MRLLQRVQIGELLLRLGGFGPRDQRHEIRQGDKNQYADDDQHHQKPPKVKMREGCGSENR